MTDDIEYPAPKKLLRAPTHPGELWRAIIEDHLKLSVSAAATRMGVSRQMLNGVLRGANAVSPEMALRFGRLTGADAELWVQMQVARDVWLAEQKLHDTLAAIETVRAA